MTHTASAHHTQSHASLNGGAHAASVAVLSPSDTFWHRHIAPSEAEIAEMLETLGCTSLDQLTEQTVPASIRLPKPMRLAGLGENPKGEHELLRELKAMASQNQIFRSFIGMGYYGTITPGVILRNILENPGWYTQYTPYQAEIAQGRLEALLNFQTMVADLTGLPLAGASLLDEGTAAGEAMTMCYAISDHSRPTFIAASDVHPQTLGVLKTRADGLGMKLVIADPEKIAPDATTCGILLQYPNTSGALGSIAAHEALAKKAKEAGALVVVATDLLALTLIKPPGEWGADIAVGCAQRFGVPMGFGGPHAAFIATSETHVRKMPGRIIGVSRDSQGNPAYRMAIQTREQHIRREKATSNICTAQALLAIIAGMYGVYHGPGGLRRIALRTHTFAQVLRAGLKKLGLAVRDGAIFDTIRVDVGSLAQAQRVLDAARARRMNLRDFCDGSVGISCDETTTREDVQAIFEVFAGEPVAFNANALLATVQGEAGAASGLAGHARQSGYMTHPIFNSHHSEHEMLRYIFKLMGRDLSLCHSMIPLGSCTMKLNATSEMIPVTWAEFGQIHPFAPADQSKGYQKLFKDLESWLSEVTGFAAVSLQPNAGAQGEYAGLMVIRAYLASIKQSHRTVCLIPESAHGTNPASAVVAGFEVVGVKNDAAGNVDMTDLRAKIAAHKDKLGALMVTYPSTYGVFEEDIREICTLVHQAGGQVYMDGANMNAQVGLTSPGFIGADVCHLNLHKTFCIPHGGGGPGMGPIGVAAHLAPFLPGHPVNRPFFEGATGTHAIGPVSAAPYGSPSILTISWVYIALMGAAGLKKATQVAILNANYMAKRLEGHYTVLFKGGKGRVAHEFIIDCRGFDKSAGIKVDDIAKRLQDYSFHGPTMSWPVPGTLMIEPTESEPKPELDRLCDALIAIREEIRAIENGTMDKADNPLKNAPHTMGMVTATQWSHPYSREQAAYPAGWLRDSKFWPHVGRVDNPYGDRNLVCSCPPMAEYAEK